MLFIAFRSVEYDFQFRLFENECKPPPPVQSNIFAFNLRKNVRYFDVGCTAEGCGFDRYPRPNKHVFQPFDWAHTEAASGCHALCSYITRRAAHVLRKGPPIGNAWAGGGGARTGKDRSERTATLPFLDSLRVAQYIFGEGGKQ